MAGTTRLELATSAVTERGYPVLTTTYKAVGDCQVLDNTHKSATSRVEHRVEKRTRNIFAYIKDVPTRAKSSSLPNMRSGKNAFVIGDHQRNPRAL